MEILRGDVYWINFNETHPQGGEIKKKRPAVVISNDLANQYSNRVQVIPVSSNISKLYPCEAVITVKKAENKAMVDQIMTVSKERLAGKVCTLSAKDLEIIAEVMRIHFKL